MIENKQKEVPRFFYIYTNGTFGANFPQKHSITMKKIHLLLLGLTICLFSACHNDIWDAIDGLDSRVTKLEELCKEMNTNITSLQTIVDVLQSNDFITGVVEIKKDGEVIGYTITFGKHDPITIYHGQDGKDGQDGQNGADGKDGITPVIGIAQDTDGVYYWTLNGEWLLNDNGNKLPVSGKDGQNGTNGSNGQDGADGKDGQDGEDGKDGADGQDGKDGITPQLKIEDGYWYISYDNGATWTQLGKATGEDGKDGADGKDGQNGADGKDGQDGDSMFQSVTQDENYVYFTLADGTVIKIAKGSSSSENRIEGQLNGVFSVSKYDKVNFSQGNLLYNPALDTWRFANEQYICYLKDKTNVSQMDSIWMDLFIWGSTGYRDLTPLVDNYNYYDFYSYEQVDIKIENYDWGVFCSIENGGNLRNKWRTLTRGEWIYLMEKRNNAKNLRTNAIVDNIEGIILLPDTSTIAIKNPNFLVDGLSYSVKTWQGLENLGCVFLPSNKYWASNPYLRDEQYGTQAYYRIKMDGQYIDLTTNTIKLQGVSLYGLGESCHVRLVRNSNN